jgi:membrane protease YdiL (CAAX protease family)
MKRKYWLTPFLMTCLFFGVLMLPFRKLYSNLFIEKYSEMVLYLTRSIIVLTFVFLLNSKLKLSAYTGLDPKGTKNIWMLLLPLVFPGLLAYGKLGHACPENYALPVIVCTFAAALNEELLFRGCIQGYLIKNAPALSYHKIFLITNFFFAAGHFINLRVYEFSGVLNQALFAYCIGLLFSAVQLRVNNIWLVGITHGLINLLFRGCSTAIHQGQVQEPAPGIIDTIISAASALLVFSPTLLIYWFLIRGVPRQKLNSISS